MSALHAEVEPFGIATTVVNPGFFRTELISEKSMVYADASIEDYDERRRAQEAWWEGQAGQQPGDPAKLAQALLRITDEQPPPRRFIAGADVIALAERKADELRAQSDAYRDLSTSMSYDDIASRPTDPGGP
jgi:NAD(P)-dependent dehydrogenase (short-subunit alcohol dehydrogenase family)